MGRPQRGWNTPVNRASETDDLRQRKPVQEGSEAPDPYADQRKWPVWMVTIAVITFCGAFWAGVSYLVSLLLG